MKLIRLREAFNPNSRTKLLGICVPTVEPKKMDEYLLSDEMLEALEPIKDIAVFLINFQPPFTEAAARRRAKKLTGAGFSIKYRLNSYNLKNGVPFNRIRSDCARIDPNCPFYLLLDDDMIAKTPSGNSRILGQQYLDGIDYLLKYRMCGGVYYTRRYYTRDPYYKSKGKIRNVIRPLRLNGMHYETGCGMLLRNLQVFDDEESPLFPVSALKMIGGGEEAVLATWRLSRGYFLARHPHTSNYHLQENTNGTARKGWTSNSVYRENLFKYLDEEFGCDYTKHVVKLKYKNRKEMTREQFEKLSFYTTDLDNQEKITDIMYQYRAGKYKFANKTKAPY